MMSKDHLETVIRRALAETRAVGKDHLTQTEEAVGAVLREFPDITASDVLAQVNRMSSLPNHQDSKDASE